MSPEKLVCPTWVEICDTTCPPWDWMRAENDWSPLTPNSSLL